jgi:hypothetical protein
MSLTLFSLVLPSSLAADYTGDGIDDLVVGIPFEVDIGTVVEPGAVALIRGSTTGLTATGDAFIHQNTAGVDGDDEDNEHFGYAIGAGDVDGDGTDDLIVGGPDALVGGDACGMVWRLELSAPARAITVTTSQSFSQDTSGVSGSAEAGDDFGAAIVVADFDGDGYDDVVVGVPGEAIGTVFHAGAVEYLRGGPTGLTTTGQREYDQDGADVADVAEEADGFGGVLAAGDFDADGYADLVIGSPNENWTGVDEGAVHLMYGSPTGPSVTVPNDEVWTAGSGSAAGTLADYNECGGALAVGDFDDDGFDDLVIGCPGYDVFPESQAGALLLVYGSSAGLDVSEMWSENAGTMNDAPEPGGAFGGTLTTGDFDGDGYDDLAAASPDHEGPSGIAGAGIVHVLFGSSTGLTSVDDVLLYQDDGAVVFGSPASFDHWGFSLTSGDYDGDGRDELAVGSSSDDDVVDAAGTVNVFPGTAHGPSTRGDQWFHQDTPGIADSAQTFDQFGYSLR